MVIRPIIVEPPATSAPTFDLRRLRPALAAYLASRAVTLVGIGVATWQRPDLGLVKALKAWDGTWYSDLARFGYPAQLVPGTEPVAQSHAFFPLLPILIRALAAVTGLPHWAAGLVVTGLFGVATVIGVWLMASALAGEAVADRAAVLVALFPGAFCFAFAYTEPLLIVFAVGCLLSLRRRRWWLAGGLAGLASATRPTGIVLALCCAWEASRAVADRREWRSLVAPVLAPMGLLAYFTYLHFHVGSFFAHFEVERRGWGHHLSLGEPFDQVGRFLSDPLADQNRLTWMVGAAVVAACGVWLVRLRPPAVVHIYVWGLLASSVFSAGLGLRPRYVLTAFPLLIAAAWRIRGRAFVAVAAGSSLLLGLLTWNILVGTAIAP